MQLQFTTSPLFGDFRLPARFWSKVRIGSTPACRPDLGPCWEWTGARREKAGYGLFWERGFIRRAHRVSYEALIGPIPEGLESDHLCRNRPCVRPTHIEPVTHAVNVLRGDQYGRRKTHCPQGHPYTPENTYHRSASGRDCRACHRIQERARKARRAMA